LYFTEAEERFVLEHKKSTIQGDVRTYLKTLEREKLLEVWKVSAPKQARWTTEHPVQARKQSKNIWKWAIERDEGDAWIYYIFAISQWLPLNHRLYYGDKSGYDHEKCNLCLLDAKEDTEHLLICPALYDEQVKLKQAVRKTIIDLDLPFARKNISLLDNITCDKWFKMAKESFSTTDHPSLSHERLLTLSRDFWQANKAKSTVTTNQFLASLRTLISKKQGQPLTPPSHLTSLLVLHFHLQIEGTTDAFHRSTVFQGWCSQDIEDRAFGAYGPILEQNLSGKNTLLILHRLTQSIPKDEIFETVMGWVGSRKPTRVLVIAPSTDVEGWVHPKNRRIFEIAQVVGFPFTNAKSLSGSTSLVLIVNKESMLLDPIDWPAIKNDLTDWANLLQIEVSIPEWTDKRFLERAFPSHRPRTPSLPISSVGCIYRFLDPHAPNRSEEKHMIQNGIPADLARLLNGANRHERTLSILGILPNQLRTIMRDSVEKPEVAWLEISKSLFWHGFEIWKKRKVLTKRFWKNIAPEEWKKKGNNQKHNNNRKGKKQRVNPSQCLDALHFLPKCHDFTKQRPTKCGCSEYHRPAKRSFTRDIQGFLDRFPFIQVPIHENNETKIKSSHHHFFTTRTDHVREQHDRGKRRKLTRV
jgi:hypothetical protein